MGDYLKAADRERGRGAFCTIWTGPLLVCLAVSISLITPKNASSDDALAAKLLPKGFHYELIMSKEDALCNGLAKVYNRNLFRLAHDFVPSEEGVYPPAVPLTYFEYSQTGFLDDIGLSEPDDREELSDMHTLYFVDLYGDGQPRTVNIQDSYRGDQVYTTVKVLKRGTSYREVVVPISQLLKLKTIDPAIVDRDGGLEGLAASEHNSSFYRDSYILRDWPNFAKIYKKYLADPKNIELPEIGDIGTIRLYLNKTGQVYFLLNKYISLPPLYNVESVVLLYQLRPGNPGQTDVCYLTTAPSLFLARLKKESRD